MNIISTLNSMYAGLSYRNANVSVQRYIHKYVVLHLYSGTTENKPKIPQKGTG